MKTLQKIIAIVLLAVTFTSCVVVAPNHRRHRHRDYGHDHDRDRDHDRR